MRQDDWENVNTGLGIRGKSKTIDTVYAERDPLTQTQLEALFRFAWLAGRVVEAVPEQMTRKWGRCKVDGDDELGKKVDGRLEELKARTQLTTAMTWARLYGGALVLIGADDRPAGKGVEEPLNIDRVRKVRFLHVVDKNFASPDGYDTDPDSERYGLPEKYRVSSSSSRAGVDDSQRVWHSSRVLRFDGVTLPERVRDANNGWHGSVLDRMYTDLRDHNSSLAGATAIAQEFGLSVLSIKNLAQDLMMKGGSKLLQERLDQFMLQLRAAGVATIDADFETFTRMSHTISGLPDILDRLFDQVVGASGIPRAILLGQAMGTSRAGADTDVLSFYDRIATRQVTELVPCMEQLCRLVFAELNVPEPEDWEWCPEPLWELDAKTKAEIHKLVADAANVCIQSGAVSPVEVRPALLESGDYEEDDAFSQALADRDPDELAGATPEPTPEELAALQQMQQGQHGQQGQMPPGKVPDGQATQGKTPSKAGTEGANGAA
jgi:phage-related protein (TIGR01555 family)